MNMEMLRSYFYLFCLRDWLRSTERETSFGLTRPTSQSMVAHITRQVFYPGSACSCVRPKQASTTHIVACRHPWLHISPLQLRQQEPQLPVETKVDFDEALETAAMNEHSSDEMLAWRCVVRRVLSRAANGLHVVTGRPQGNLSPHHPIVHGGEEMKRGGYVSLWILCIICADSSTWPYWCECRNVAHSVIHM